MNEHIMLQLETDRQVDEITKAASQFDYTRLMYEDELPEDITEEEYTLWFNKSYVDGVRVGPRLLRVSYKPEDDMQYTVTDKGITYYDTEPEPIPDDKAVKVVEEVAAKQRAALECQCEGRKCGECHD